MTFHEKTKGNTKMECSWVSTTTSAVAPSGKTQDSGPRAKSAARTGSRETAQSCWTRRERQKRVPLNLEAAQLLTMNQKQRCFLKTKERASQQNRKNIRPTLPRKP